MTRPFQILYVLLLFAIPPSLVAQNYGAGARFIGLSNASVSVSDTWSTFHNQATLAEIQTTSAGVFYESRFLVDELSLSALSAVLPIKSGTFGLSFYQFGQGTFKENKFGLAFSKKLSKTFNAGIQLDYFISRYPENEGRFGFATFEAGFTYRLNKHICLGTHLFNPIKNGWNFPQGQQEFPFVFRLGGHYLFRDKVLLGFETEKRTNFDPVVKTGFEFSLIENMALRFGVSGKPVQYSAGLGYRVKNITTNIGFSYHGNLGFSPSVSLQFNRE